MLINKISTFLRSNKLISTLILISFLSSLRNLFLPLLGDEGTYASIAENIVYNGTYWLNGRPSTVTPILPFILAFFYTKSAPAIGFIFAKLLNLLLVILGLKYLYLFLRNLQLDKELLCCIMLLTIVNNNFVFWSLILYPESILFCFFWMFIYFTSKEVKQPKDFIYILFPFIILVMTRYVFLVFSVMLVIMGWNYLKVIIQNRNYRDLQKLIFYSLLAVLPVIFWFKFVYNAEQNFDIGLSYFAKFKNNDIFYHLKTGIGLEGRNGIPAFISLFIPITSIRSWLISSLLLITFIAGFITKFKDERYRKLFVAILLVQIGLIFAGTGFSRYWLPMLPGYLLGFYLFYKSMKLKDSHFIMLAKIVAVIYVANEMRLNVQIMTNL